ncbi:MAG: signal peptidase I [Anaerolineales bacterium]|nr:signal peptidase I [Anaerolineales bacterium]
MESFNSSQTQPENPTADETVQPSDVKRMVWDIVETLFLAFVLYFGINAVSARVRVDGYSMNPTLDNGEYILVNKLAYKLGEPTRGDIIVFKFPLDPNQDLIKRVIGLPGETVTVQNGKVSVNGTPLDEPYISDAPFYIGSWFIKEGELFVLGDNRNESKDSHEWGLLPMENVIGRAVIIYWPPTNWEVLDHFEHASASQ